MLDGKVLAAEIRRQVAAEVERRKKEDSSFKPALTILQVGGREDSNVYIRMKSKAAREVSASKNNNVARAVHPFLSARRSASSALKRIELLNEACIPTERAGL